MVKLGASPHLEPYLIKVGGDRLGRHLQSCLSGGSVDNAIAMFPAW